MPNNSNNSNNNNSDTQFLFAICLFAGFFIITAAWRTYLDKVPVGSRPVFKMPAVKIPTINIPTINIPLAGAPPAETPLGEPSVAQAPATERTRTAGAPVSKVPRVAPSAAQASKMPSPNAYDFYTIAAMAFVEVNSKYDTEKKVRRIKLEVDTELTGKDREAWLQENVHSLKVLRKGLQFSCRVPDPPLPGKGPIPTYSIVESVKPQVFYSMAQMLLLESKARRERGDWNGAFESLLDLQKFGIDLSQGGVTRGGLNSMRYTSISFQEIRDVHPRLNAVQAKAAVRRWEAILENRLSFADILRAEKEFYLARLLRYLEMNQHRQTRGEGRRPFSKGQISYLAEEYREYFDTLIALAQSPFDPKTKEPTRPTSTENPPLPYIMPLNQRFKERQWMILMHELHDSFLLTAIALHAYRLEHKSYPQDLSQLVPAYLKQVPRDAFGDRKPLLYTLTGQKYSLYSVGPDGIDDGGRAIDYKFHPDRSIRDALRYQIFHSSRGDIVMGVNLARAKP